MNVAVGIRPGWSAVLIGGDLGVGVVELRRLGADVSIEGRVAYISGVERLTAAPLTAGDLRGGAAMIVAALSAEGETEIFDEEHISRGYDRLDRQLAALGAEISCDRASN